MALYSSTSEHCTRKKVIEKVFATCWCDWIAPIEWRVKSPTIDHFELSWTEISWSLRNASLRVLSFNLLIKEIMNWTVNRNNTVIDCSKTCSIQGIFLADVDAITRIKVVWLVRELFATVFLSGFGQNSECYPWWSSVGGGRGCVWNWMIRLVMNWWKDWERDRDGRQRRTRVGFVGRSVGGQDMDWWSSAV